MPRPTSRQFTALINRDPTRRIRVPQAVARQLGGVNSRTIPLALLKAGKSSTREGSAEAAKDRSDAQALSGLEP